MLQEAELRMNRIRGFLLDRGIAIRKGPSYLVTQPAGHLYRGDSSFSGRLLHLIRELKHEWDELERKIAEASAELARIAKMDDGCHRLMEVPGFGPIVSTALVAAIGNGISFRKGRDLAAWLGLVPRQHSTGGKTRLLGISKLGNEYLRRMMLHGARSVVMQMERKPSALGEWLTSLSSRRHRNVTVALLLLVPQELNFAEAVSNVTIGQYVLRIRAITFNLFAKLTYEHSQILPVTNRVGAAQSGE